MFNDLINTINIAKPKLHTLIPVNEYMVDGLVQLVENSRGFVSSIHHAQFDLSLWFNDFLIKNHQYINYVTITPSFNVLSIEDKLVEMVYSCKELTFNSDDELDDFFIKNEENIIVLYTIGKFVDLTTLKVFYKLRYTDITQKREKRNILINKILK